MKILALDCGKSKSVFLEYHTANGAKEYGKLLTCAADIHDLLVARKPDVRVLEIGPDAGWIYDIAAALSIPTQVANTNDQRWQWKKTRNKNDRKDALKMAQMTEMRTFAAAATNARRSPSWRWPADFGCGCGRCCGMERTGKSPRLELGLWRRRRHELGQDKQAPPPPTTAPPSGERGQDA